MIHAAFFSRVQRRVFEHRVLLASFAIGLLAAVAALRLPLLLWQLSATRQVVDAQSKTITALSVITTTEASVGTTKESSVETTKAPSVWTTTESSEGKTLKGTYKK